MTSFFDTWLFRLLALALCMAAVGLLCFAGAAFDRWMSRVGTARDAREIDRQGRAHRRLMAGSVRTDEPS